MIVALLFLVVTYFVARYLVQRYSRNGVLANSVAAAIVLWYIIGAAMHPPLFGRPQVATAPPSNATAPPRLALSAGQLNALVPVKGTAALGNIDVLTKPDGSPAGSRFPSDAKVEVDGWVADPLLRTPGAGLIFIIDGSRRFDATKWYGTDRPDVAEAYGIAALAATGFHGVPLPLSGLGAGSHTLSAGVIAPDGRRYYALPARVSFEVY